jgi:hypothetical protein
MIVIKFDNFNAVYENSLWLRLFHLTRVGTRRGKTDTAAIGRPGATFRHRG